MTRQELDALRVSAGSMGSAHVLPCTTLISLLDLVDDLRRSLDCEAGRSAPEGWTFIKGGDEGVPEWQSEKGYVVRHHDGWHAVFDGDENRRKVLPVHTYALDAIRAVEAE